MKTETMWTIVRRAFLGVLASAFATFASTIGMAQALEQELTVAAECGGQQQIDQPHRVTVTVTDSNGNDCVTTVYLQPQTHIDAIVGLIVQFISVTCDIPIGPSGLHTAETTHPDYDSDAGRLQAEDIHVPVGWRVTKVKVEKLVSGLWQEDDGHLKVHVTGVKTNGIQASLLDFFEIGLEPYTATPIAVQIAMVVQRPTGPAGTLSYQHTFASTATVSQIHAAIATWAAGKGMATSYPNSTTLRITPDPNTLIVRQVWVSFFEDSDDATLPSSSIEWRFNVQ
jgi:hypothetical protein